MSEDFNLNKALKELEQINDWFQSEDVDLEEGLKKFKKGLRLIKQARHHLKSVESEVEEVKKKFEVEESRANE